jgi:hypothetical protein
MTDYTGLGSNLVNEAKISHESQPSTGSVLDLDLLLVFGEVAVLVLTCGHPPLPGEAV